MAICACLLLYKHQECSTYRLNIPLSYRLSLFHLGYPGTIESLGDLLSETVLQRFCDELGAAFFVSGLPHFEAKPRIHGQHHFLANDLGLVLNY